MGGDQQRQEDGHCDFSSSEASQVPVDRNFAACVPFMNMAGDSPGLQDEDWHSDCTLAVRSLMYLAENKKKGPLSAYSRSAGREPSGRRDPTSFRRQAKPAGSGMFDKFVEKFARNIFFNTLNPTIQGASNVNFPRAWRGM